MNIGELSKLSGVSSKMIRRYEDDGIVAKAKRTDSGYRVYQDQDVQIFKFIKRSRELGFSLSDTKQLVSLWRNKSRSSAKVKEIAKQHVQDLTEKLNETRQMILQLNHLVKNCHGDSRPDCPIIDDLESH
ncbi:MAG: Cu(I)-responsive transcriptional regulator [Bdellovibrionales bacterium CG12_big_fil_rev_8_21_14_0_65_38_15]|nr:MAG: Cu(I)-responsive transcriptional regulator [Bdellovibrionales bacterium CG22_combo_CG10-13_8_21_14_all_38_13]PIQ56235.1 MAG: Cu(I)-responsive transcriptional regulator [Bdellovibrionales bacterium CG12_big_fil_rev_8_21_14_0_65_38_15]PIR30379.1 MAG: Cu(I)-responsive transcriptional regulator [Bdellovibrionales bacterium CG11_big_fil_rev_8_21_14_0_20_38_13]